MAKLPGIKYVPINRALAAGTTSLNCWVPSGEALEAMLGRGGLFSALTEGGFELAMPAHLRGVPGGPGKLAYMQGETEHSAMCIVFLNGLPQQGALISIAIYWHEGQEALAQAKLSTLPSQLRLPANWVGVPKDLTEAVELAKAMESLSIELLNIIA